MALSHGRKSYFQVLLDVNRAELLLKFAGEQGTRATAIARDAIYNYLERQLPTSVYEEAKAKDEAIWRESVRKRVEGRQNARAERKAKEKKKDYD